MLLLFTYQYLLPVSLPLFSPITFLFFLIHYVSLPLPFFNISFFCSVYSVLNYFSELVWYVPFFTATNITFIIHLFIFLTLSTLLSFCFCLSISAEYHQVFQAEIPALHTVGSSWCLKWYPLVIIVFFQIKDSALGLRPVTLLKK